MQKSCKLLEGFLTYFLQSLLGLLALTIIYFKWKREYPKRENKVVLFDVSKQIFGMAFAHLLNIAIAIMLSSHFMSNNECRWYFINFLIDVVFGIPINYGLLCLSNYYIRKHSIKRLETGNYITGYNCCNISYTMQLCLWIFIILLSKTLTLLIVILPFQNQLNSFGKWVLGPVSSNVNLELAVVMVIFPIILNIIQFWVQDNFLKGKRHYIETSLINPNNLEENSKYIHENPSTKVHTPPPKHIQSLRYSKTPNTHSEYTVL